jgi:hypothetical protein
MTLLAICVQKRLFEQHLGRWNEADSASMREWYLQGTALPDTLFIGDLQAGFVYWLKRLSVLPGAAMRRISPAVGEFWAQSRTPLEHLQRHISSWTGVERRRPGDSIRLAQASRAAVSVWSF